jgi:hypothetical protein
MEVRNARFARLGWAEMKSKMRRAAAQEIRAQEMRTQKILRPEARAGMMEAGESRLTGNDHVRIEMQSFLQALRSYPERFARNPRLTFEEHRSGLVQTAKAEPRRRD